MQHVLLQRCGLRRCLFFAMLFAYVMKPPWLVGVAREFETPKRQQCELWKTVRDSCLTQHGLLALVSGCQGC